MKVKTMHRIKEDAKKKRAKLLLRYERSNCDSVAHFARTQKVSASYITSELRKARKEAVVI